MMKNEFMLCYNMNLNLIINMHITNVKQIKMHLQYIVVQCIIYLLNIIFKEGVRC